MPKKKKPAPHEYWCTDEGLLQIQYWGMLGYTKERIAECMGVSDRTLRRWIKELPAIQKIFKTIEDGNTVMVAAVVDAMFKKALAGDLNAMKFILKNRDPEHWSEYPELKNADKKAVFIDDIPAQSGVQKGGMSAGGSNSGTTSGSLEQSNNS